MTNSDGVLDWDSLSDEDKARVQQLHDELQELFNKYTKKEEEPCEDSTSEE
jgi:TRAP-type C4-dicarboxylate transport system substrate-binding protein